jgi:hypothetical protein
MKAIHIDATARTVSLVDYSDLQDMRRLVGGHIEVQQHWYETGEILYGDEEGMLKAQSAFYKLEGIDRPLAGSAIIVGREIDDAGHTEDPTLTVEQVTAMVRFITREQAEAWGKANASEPAFAISTLEKDGRMNTTVLGTYGQLYRDMPKPQSGEDE